VINLVLLLPEASSPQTPHIRSYPRPTSARATKCTAMLDLILEGGHICDGTGEPPFVTDIAVAADRIVRIGDCREFEALARVQCTGRVVAPGFIDMHGHSDETLLVLPSADSKIRQGITTEVGGNCGASPAPLAGIGLRERREELQHHLGFAPAWTNFDGFFSELEHARPTLNFCCLVGLGTIRSSIDAVTPAPLDAEALAQAQRLVHEACEQGAIGISSGLIYPPGSFADTNELIAMADAAADAGSPLYATHIRNEGDELLEAVDEALEVGRRSACAVQLSHHKASRRRNWGKVHDSLAAVERARNSGLDVVLDQYPYIASSTGLDVILPPDVRVGSRDDIASRLSDHRYAALVAARVELDYGGRWHEVLVASVDSQKNQPYQGMNIAEIGQAMGCAPVAAALRLLVDENLDVAAIYFTMCEDDVRTVLSYQHTAIGTDAVVRAPFGVTSTGKPHPRTYGTFPRIFRRYVRETPVLPLPEAVRRATSLAAGRLGLRQRGLLAAGFFADIVVFDRDRISDTATYLDPHRFPEGIDSVYVNGQAAVRDGAATGLRPGRVLRRGRDL
jgi:N-acyl-D-amino-acid deacylase